MAKKTEMVRIEAFVDPKAQKAKILRAVRRYSKIEKKRVTQSEITRRLIDRGLTAKGEFSWEVA